MPLCGIYRKGDRRCDVVGGGGLASVVSRGPASSNPVRGRWRIRPGIYMYKKKRGGRGRKLCGVKT